jgi:hypothetical protein
LGVNGLPDLTRSGATFAYFSLFSIIKISISQFYQKEASMSIFFDILNEIAYLYGCTNFCEGRTKIEGENRHCQTPGIIKLPEWDSRRWHCWTRFPRSVYWKNRPMRKRYLSYLIQAFLFTILLRFSERGQTCTCYPTSYSLGWTSFQSKDLSTCTEASTEYTYGLASSYSLSLTSKKQLLLMRA